MDDITADFARDYQMGLSWSVLGQRYISDDFADKAREAQRFAVRLGLPERETAKPSLESAMRRIQEAGYSVTPKQSIQGIERVEGEDWDGEGELRLGVISCTHFGSREHNVEALESFYQHCYDTGVENVVHCGDLTEGSGKMHPGQAFGMSVFGFDATVDYVANEYPGLPGITTWVLEGNHDRSWFKDSGGSIVKAISDKRGDFRYLGIYQSLLTFGAYTVCVSHQKGGPKYGAGKLEQNIQALPRSLDVSLYTLGHFHNPVHLPDKDGIVGLQVGCFQRQTEFERQNQLIPRIGGWIVSIVRGENGYTSTATWRGVRS